MAALNSWSITGNLVKDPVLRETKSGKTVCSFRVAVNGWQEEDVQWVDVTTWGKTAEACGNHLAKGSQIAAQGRCKLRTWEHEGKAGSTLELIANDITFIGRKVEKQEEQSDDGYTF